MAITSILSEFWSMFLCSKCHTCDVTWQVKVWHLCNIVGSTWKWSQTLGMISDIWNNVTQTHMSHFHLSRDITSVTFGIMTQNHWEYLFWPYIDLKIELMTIQNYLGQNNTWLPKNYNLISEPILQIATPISPNWKTNFIPNFISILPLIIPNVCDHFQVNPKMLQKCHIFACQVTSQVWHLE